MAARAMPPSVTLAAVALLEPSSFKEESQVHQYVQENSSNPLSPPHTQGLWGKDRDRGSLDRSGFLILTQQSYTHVHTDIQLHICTFTHAGTYIHIFAHSHPCTHTYSDTYTLALPGMTLDTGPRLVRPHYRASRATTALRSPQNWPGGAQVVVGLSKLEATKVSGPGALSVCLS